MKTKKQLVQYRWGRKRSPSTQVRVSRRSSDILRLIPDKLRRSIIDKLIADFSTTPTYSQIIANTKL